MRSCRTRRVDSAPRVGAAISDHLHPDALGLRELVERRLAEVAAVAGLLDAAVGDRRVDHLVRVDPHGADAGEDGRLVEVAAVAVAGAAERQLGALVLADPNVALDPLELPG